ncbi:MAG: type II secretion system F family protein [Candidatus Gastranaerophilales bacterium]|nr:type II secretion system F family protein [Candidatus Gastranaerophilales bacterium]
MKTFKYYAIKKEDGTKVEGKIEAVNDKEARSLIIQLDLFPTRIIDPTASSYSETAVRQQQADARKKVRLGKLSGREKIDFTTTLQILLKAGVPLIEALVFLESDTNSVRLRSIASEIRKQVIAGVNFADTVAKFPQIFDALYIGLVRAGEESGELDVTLERMSKLLKKQDDLKSKIIGVLAYPCIVLLFAVVIVLVMLMFVFPKFAEMYEGMGAQLPWITQMCIDTGKFLAKFWMVLPIFFATIYWFLIGLFAFEPFKNRFDQFLLSIPLIRDFVKLAEFSNFISVMLVSYEAGVPIVDCLYLGNFTITNNVINTAIKTSAVKVQQGLHLSDALKSSEVVPPIILFMISTGEQSGKLGEMLEKSSEFIDNQLDRIIDLLTKFIEPIMLVFIGAVVLVLALALYLPLFQSYSHIGS